MRVTQNPVSVNIFGFELQNAQKCQHNFLLRSMSLYIVYKSVSNDWTLTDSHNDRMSALTQYQLQKNIVGIIINIFDQINVSMVVFIITDINKTQVQD